jgi:gluconate 5-dehydrogenase
MAMPMLDIFSLEGRVALVTGASRGLGYAMARALGAAGARVVLNARDAAALERAAAEMARDRIATAIAPFDVTDEAAATAALARIVAEHGRLDILVSNAGINIRKPILEYATDDFLKVIDTNLTSCFVLAREAGKLMVPQRKGRIVMTTSMMGKIARPTISAYSAAKAGLDALTRALAVELGPKGITCNAIAPGYFATELNKPLMANAEFNEFVQHRTPVGRWGQPEELGGAVVFLASDAGSFVNGHTLMIDGGLTAAL